MTKAVIMASRHLRVIAVACPVAAQTTIQAAAVVMTIPATIAAQATAPTMIQAVTTPATTTAARAAVAVN